MTNLKGLGGLELNQIADAVAREKSINKQEVLEAMTSSIAVAARKKYGHDKNITAEINPKTGEINLFRNSEVVADDHNLAEDEEAGKKMLLSIAKSKQEDAKIGDIITEPLPPIDLGRVAAQTAKQVIVQKIRDAERDRQYEDYKARVGEIVNATVKRVEGGNIIVDLGNAEAIILRDQVIRGENFKVNDRLRAYLLKVQRQVKGAQIFLSRTAPQFMAKLFASEVPEIYDGIIEIKNVVREPGSRAKIAVYSNDSSIDPVGSCVGLRGARVQAVMSELKGERIDIIQWSADRAAYLVNALAPAEVSKVVIDEENNNIEVVVAEDQLSLAIGKRGQNVRLASELIGWNIDILTEEAESTRRVEDFNKASKLFIEALNIEEIMAHLLVTEGFQAIEDIAYCETAELASVEGLDEEIAAQLQDRANEYLDNKQLQVEEVLQKNNVSQDFIDFEALDLDIIAKFSENGITTLDDFAGLSRDEFIEIVPDSGLSDRKIDEIIMEARSSWFEEEDNNSEDEEPQENA